MWEIQKLDEYDKQAKKWTKHHRRELLALLGKLEDVLQSLQVGAADNWFLDSKRVRNEKHGLWALDQKGCGRGLTESRLYIYPDRQTETLFILGLGLKGTQSRDLKRHHKWVKSLLVQREEK